jgi:hypothetical protein
MPIWSRDRDGARTGPPLAKAAGTNAAAGPLRHFQPQKGNRFATRRVLRSTGVIALPASAIGPFRWGAKPEAEVLYTLSGIIGDRACSSVDRASASGA